MGSSDEYEEYVEEVEEIVVSSLALMYFRTFVLLHLSTSALLYFKCYHFGCFFGVKCFFTMHL